jgi:hypothetical protein
MWTPTLPPVTAKRLNTAKRWAKTWKQATSGQNGQASLNVTRTRKLPRVTEETPENATSENAEMGDVGRKWASVA